ncbi:hypothetical protein [Ottowia sp.]|uniref:hypothetical protein n=1 Tax=Ottowia sp. TaxID=1898956 RepID=UPI0039E4366E
MGRDKRRDAGRDAGGFVALPWAVLDSAAYQGLNHAARSLLLEIARQYVRDNNGRLLASENYLIEKRGWKSGDTITRALRELVAAGLVHQTVQGQRPNKASWYAITWQTLDRHPGYDLGAVESFERSAYRNTPTQTIGVDKRNKPAKKSYTLTPTIGAIRPQNAPLSTPTIGDHLEKPSPADVDAAVSDDDQPCENRKRPASATKPLSIPARIVALLLTGPKTSLELDEAMGMKGAAGFVRKRMVRDGIAYAVKAERFSMPPRRGFVARYTLTAEAIPTIANEAKTVAGPRLAALPP